MTPLPSFAALPQPTHSLQGSVQMGSLAGTELSYLVSLHTEYMQWDSLFHPSPQLS